jgi:large subunit ribosomal protein L21
MYAIVDIAGQQFKVQKDQKLYVHRLEGDEGNKVAFDRVMLLDTGSKVLVGDPLVKGASVSAKILEHVKGDKVLVFKKKRRKGYKKLNGHRQYMTQIQIEGISEKSAAATKAAEKKEAPAAKKEAPEAKKETAAKKPAPKKEATAASTQKQSTTEKKKPAAKSTKEKSPATTKEATAKSTSAKSASSKSTAAKKKADHKEDGEGKAEK